VAAGRSRKLSPDEMGDGATLQARTDMQPEVTPTYVCANNYTGQYLDNGENAASADMVAIVQNCQCNAVSHLSVLPTRISKPQQGTYKSNIYVKENSIAAFAMYKQSKQTISFLASHSSNGRKPTSFRLVPALSAARV
jgi:hypothetical protein